MPQYLIDDLTLPRVYTGRAKIEFANTYTGTDSYTYQTITAWLYVNGDLVATLSHSGDERERLLAPTLTPVTNTNEIAIKKYWEGRIAYAYVGADFDGAAGLPTGSA